MAMPNQIYSSWSKKLSEAIRVAEFHVWEGQCYDQ
jgi:hypothetical protein